MTTSIADRLRAGECADPRSVLGAHPCPDGIVVRAFRPGARSVAVVVDDGRRVELDPLGDGLFETVVHDATFPFAYRLDVEGATGTRHVVADAYSFGPTMGELDLHLIGEGRHRDLAHRL